MARSFVGNRANAELAAEIIERIRTDELIHVRSLCVYLGELQSVTFRTVDGGTVSGRELFGRFWDGMVRWATFEQPRLAAEQIRSDVDTYIATHADADRVRAEFAAAG